ncbi:uncharacterized protein LOC128681502 [Plodia interpunctella]|uniref:uncharacterized protein LOC128681502 n=1 Tax=Plodia interpunctella TaxID=58824 RepID=UPI002367CFA1|nr:uncharacterized protein LOC128681502 [Plodia interpunctella]
MMSKITILCSIVLLVQEISSHYLNYGNLQNGVGNSYAANNPGSNPYAANNLGANNPANAHGLNNVAANMIATGNNLNLANNLASNVPYNLGQNLPTNSAINVANVASTPINTGLFEGISASNGGVFSVTSVSPIVPSGLSVFSDNLLIEGPLTVTGQLPFLSAVAVEGALPSSGQGVAGCGCGDGNIGIVNELNNAGLYGGLGKPGLGLAGRFF